MGLFGGEDKKKKVFVPPGYILLHEDQSAPQISQSARQANPWQQTIQKANSNRSAFFNNISGQSWNMGKAKGREAMKRRRHPL